MKAGVFISCPLLRNLKKYMARKQRKKENYLMVLLKRITTSTSGRKYKLHTKKSDSEFNHQLSDFLYYLTVRKLRSITLSCSNASLIVNFSSKLSSSSIK